MPRGPRRRCGRRPALSWGTEPAGDPQRRQDVVAGTVPRRAASRRCFPSSRPHCPWPRRSCAASRSSPRGIGARRRPRPASGGSGAVEDRAVADLAGHSAPAIGTLSQGHAAGVPSHRDAQLPESASSGDRDWRRTARPCAVAELADELRPSSRPGCRWSHHRCARPPASRSPGGIGARRRPPTGVRRSMLVPSPSQPATIVPPAVGLVVRVAHTAGVPPPALTVRNRSPPATATGVGRSVVVPSPSIRRSCSPSSRRDCPWSHHRCGTAPALTWRKRSPPATATGVSATAGRAVAELAQTPQQ